MARVTYGMDRISSKGTTGGVAAAGGCQTTTMHTPATGWTTHGSAEMVCGCSEGTYQRGWRWTATASTRTCARSGWARDTVVKGRLAPTAPKSVQHRDANMGMELPAQTKRGHITLRVCPPGVGERLTACRSNGAVFASRTGSWQVQGKHKRGRGDTLRPRELVPTGVGLG
jgi:hypothetical protein